MKSHLVFRLALVASLTSTLLPAADQHKAAQEPQRTQATGDYFESDADAQHDDLPTWESLADRQYLLGDWWGARDGLSDNGLDVSLTYVTNMAGNPVGGVSRGFTETDSTGLNIGADFEKIAGLEGLTGFVSMAYRQGTSLTLRRIHNVVSVQQVYGGQTFHLVNLFAQQKLFDGEMSIKAGRIAQFDDFSHDFAFGYYMNNAFDGQPVGFFFQGTFTAYPTTTWGSIMKWGKVIDDYDGIYAYLGVYGADTEMGDNEYHGARFSFDFNRGANVMGEVGYKHLWGPAARYQEGLPGKYAVGAWWFSGDFPQWTTNTAGPTPEKSGIGGFYYLVHQALFRDELAPTMSEPDVQSANAETYWSITTPDVVLHRGLFAWSTAQFAAPSTSTMDVFFSAGLYYRGLPPNRPQDVLALGYYRAFFSNDLAAQQVAQGQLPQDYESAVELGYRYYLTQYFYVQPNIQYVFNPGGTGAIDDALVLGAQIEIDF